MTRPTAIGVDIGGTQLRAALVDADGKILSRAATRTDAAGGPVAIIAQIGVLVAEIASGAERGNVLGIGVAVPGPLDTESGTALGIPTLTGWENVPVGRLVEQALGLPVRLENDGIAAANGEWRFGAGRGLANLVYVTVSTGIGGGVVLDGRLVHGQRGLAGHVGHMTIVKNGQLCACGNKGCWEAYASGTALARAAKQAFAPDEGGVLQGAFDSKAVFAAARAGDATAARLVSEEADWLGVGIANLLHLYSPQMVVIGGGVSNGFELLQEGINARIQANAMPAFRAARIVPAALGDNSGLLGAAALLLPIPLTQRSRA
ncbi:MAG: ROK family protein [Devosia sp.]|nr:ROK family protein [Devosia sp.]